MTKYNFKIGDIVLILNPGFYNCDKDPKIHGIIKDIDMTFSTKYIYVVEYLGTTGFFSKDELRLLWNCPEYLKKL